MAVSGVKWENIDYDLSVFRNYRNLKDFVEHKADESWPWFSQRFDYLNQIKFFSKQDLSEYYPSENLDKSLEVFDAPFPVYNRHFFSHLPLQLIFSKFNRIENLLDYHFRSYTKYKPEYENAFLNILEHRVVGVIEHNQINNYNEISIAVLKWIRGKREFLELKKSSAKYVSKVYYEFVDIRITIINNWTNNTPPIQTPASQPSENPTTPKSKSPKQEYKISIKSTLLNAFAEDIYELVMDSDVDLKAFAFKINRSLEGKPVMPKYKIASGKIGALCRIIRRYYDDKKAFPGVPKKDLAHWIVLNFVKQKGTKEEPLSYNTVYNILRGSKK